VPAPSEGGESDEEEQEPEPLRGHHISESDCEAIVSRLIGEKVNYEHIEIESIVVPYKGERRLATCRNVQEIKQGFVAVQMTVDRDDERECAHGCGLCSWTWLRCIRSCLTPYYVMVVCNIFLCAWIAAHTYLRFLRGGGWCPSDHEIVQTLPWLICSIVSSVYWWCLGRDRGRHVSICYIPHLVSAVMAEYDRGTNAVAARSTMRQRIRRLACLPIPDEDALKFIVGTELVCEQLLDQEDFFWEGAACFRQPE
jgi:hypothetical protein